MKQLTQEDILEAGIRAASILGNADLMGFLEEERELLLVALSNTQPHETKRRESLFYQHYAISDFINGLKQRVEAGRSIVEANEAESTNEDYTD